MDFCRNELTKGELLSRNDSKTYYLHDNVQNNEIELTVPVFGFDVDNADACGDHRNNPNTPTWPCV
jgi:hypothetical protein